MLFASKHCVLFPLVIGIARGVLGIIHDSAIHEVQEYPIITQETSTSQQFPQLLQRLFSKMYLWMSNCKVVSKKQTSKTGRPTVAPTNKSITAVYGQPLTLTMEFCANPPYNKVFWIAKDHRVYKPGDADKTIIAYGITNSSEPNCHQAVLFLTKVTSIDIGEYSFIVRSPNGLSEGNFHVNLTYASGYNVQADDVNSESSTTHIFASIYINVIVLILHHC